ncbi:sugar transferase [Chitinispirillales bacterium ANBcel5]|uniref:sugar transferase n=1 Tax=Cellulosispirillum alkaliphilum TaxID=3039283 RepID=UPI002A56A1E8|nr:sugar transferase [Chitinispirillales bacterium ANBcel5]
MILRNRLQYQIKLFFDKVSSLLLLASLLPVFIIISILIKLDSHGPVIFKQKRLGKNGKEFTIYKFRTMCDNAVTIGKGIFVAENDSRITRVGKLLRATSMDELPQLWNVFIGDMSLVGPRPPLPHHPYRYEEYPESHRKRFEVKPGITGLTQVTVRNSVPWEKRIAIDIEYITQYNYWLDIKILFKTAKKVFLRENIYTAQ